MFGLTSGTNMRGLNEFISDIRACKEKQSQTKRVNTELAKIRQKFITEKGLSAYNRKKYVWKLLYIHILGYDVDFGFNEAASLINASKYDEKYTGYISSSNIGRQRERKIEEYEGIGLLISESNVEIWKIIASSIEADIRSGNESYQSLALSMIASIVPEYLINALSPAIVDLASTNKCTPTVRRKSLMCLSRILKKFPKSFDSNRFIPIVGDLLGERNQDLSLVSASMTLLLTLITLTSPDKSKFIQPKIVNILHRLAISKDCPSNYLYYANPNPWLQMKLYRALQVWSPPEEKVTLTQLEEIVSKVLRKNDSSKSVNKSNTEYGLLFEAINLVVLYDDKLDRKLIQDVSKILVVFISSSLANTRYLGLEAMCKLAIKHDLAQHQTKVLANLEDQDISIRRRALDLLYLICNRTNATTIVAEMLGYLQNRNDPQIRDDLVLKIAILAEKFAQNLVWYVNVVVKLIQNAQVENDIWYRILQIITGFVQYNPQLQSHAALRLYQCLQLPHITETMKCVGSYVLSEFSEYLVKAGKEPRKIFEVIQKHFQTANNKSKAMMLNALVKLSVRYEPLRQECQMILHMCSEHWDPDVQQRGVQFIALLGQTDEIQRKVIEINPAFTEEQKQSNPLFKKFAKGGRKLHQAEKNKNSSGGSSTQQSVSNVSNHPLFNHPCFRMAIDKLSPTLLNYLNIPGRMEVKPYWKDALVKKAAFDECELKEKIQDLTLKVILSISIQTAEMQFKFFRNKGFQVSASPIKYGPQAQQIMLTFTPTGQKSEPPVVGAAWKEKGTGKLLKKEVQLPITICKFLKPVQFTYDKFAGFYRQFSLHNDKYYKMDAFWKVPDAIKGVDFLKKIGSFFSSVGNFKCNAHPSMESLQLIYGVSSIALKVEDKTINYPILVEVEPYENPEQSVVRVSLRGGHGNTIVAIYELAALYFT